MQISILNFITSLNAVEKQNLYDYEQLKSTHREQRANFPEDLSVRIHRALSWLQRAEKFQDDVDTSFIFYWISFNAAYSGKQTRIEFQSETSSFRHFFERVIAVDNQNDVYNLIWRRFSQEVKGILTNKYIFNGYWNEFHAGDIEDWESSFSSSKHRVNKALSNEDALQILSILFSRIYVLRNQIFHGNSTWNSAVNREQIIDCTKLLSHLIPIFLNIMMRSPEQQWGKINYPVQP